MTISENERFFFLLFERWKQQWRCLRSVKAREIIFGTSKWQGNAHAMKKRAGLRLLEVAVAVRLHVFRARGRGSREASAGYRQLQPNHSLRGEHKASRQVTYAVFVS